MKTSRDEIYRIIKKIGDNPGKFIDVDLTNDPNGPLVKHLIDQGFLYKRSDQGHGDCHRIYLSGVGEQLYEKGKSE